MERQKSRKIHRFQITLPYNKNYIQERFKDSEYTIDDTLIDNETRYWNIHKIRALFHSNVAADILKILICPIDDEDKRIWNYEKNYEDKSIQC